MLYYVNFQSILMILLHDYTHVERSRSYFVFYLFYAILRKKIILLLFCLHILFFMGRRLALNVSKVVVIVL